MQDTPEDAERRWERRLALPVLIAALVSVPAIFLTMIEGPAASTGTVVNALSGVVLTGETVILFIVSSDKREWVRRNWWLVALTVLIVLSVVLAIGPVQLLRLLRLVGALRVLRVGRILKAGRLLSGRFEGTWAHLSAFLASVLVALFVALTLADPTSQVRVLAEDVLPWSVGPVAVTIAALLLAGATFVVLFDRGRGDSDADETEDAESR